MNKKSRYLKQIYAIFTEYGVKSFTLDEIASKIGITKMTLYNNFKSKDTLMNDIISYRENAFSEYINSLGAGDSSAIDMLIKVLMFQKDTPHPNSMIFYQSLRQSYPDLYTRYMDNFKMTLKNYIEENLRRGIDEGIYITTLNPEAISGYILAAMDGMMSGGVSGASELDLNRVHHDMIIYHLRGIVNEKGAQQLKTLLKHMH